MVEGGEITAAGIVTGDQIIFPAGRYGIYRLGIDTFNLLAPPEVLN